MNNISFGQYVPGTSWIYKLDPRLKIVLSIFFIVLVFLIPISTNGLYMMLGALALYILVFLSTRIPVMKVINGLKPMIFLLLFTVVLQLAYTTGTKETLVYSFEMQFGLFQILILCGLFGLYAVTKRFIPCKILYLLVIVFLGFLILWTNPFEAFSWSFIYSFKPWHFVIYQEGVNKSVFIFIRIVLMIGITSLLTLSTMSTDINNGIESVLSPLKVIHVPVGVFAMLISLTLRFIPTLMIESKKIMNAQASRGVDFSEGNLRSKVNQIIALLVPMFVISFKKADDLSNAMIARGYEIDGKRTKIDKLSFHWYDYFVLAISLGLLVVVILGRIYL